MEQPPEQVAQLIQSIGAGDEQAADKLLPLVYEELRRLASARMAQLGPSQTLQPTALVHEAWLRLVGSQEQQLWNSRGHFFAAAAEAMRRILIERARRKAAGKHGGGLRRLDLDDVDIAEEANSEVLLAVDEALNSLAEQDPTAAQLIKLRFFAGMPNVQAAEVLGVPERSAKRIWAYARAWLYKEISKKL